MSQFPSFIDDADTCYLPLCFADIKYYYDKNSRIESVAICYKYRYCMNVDSKQLGMYNRKVFELQTDQFYIINMECVEVPVLMIHACCINKNQVSKYFGINDNSFRQGLCSKKRDKLYHNCTKNLFFFLDPYISRNCSVLYIQA